MKTKKIISIKKYKDQKKKWESKLFKNRELSILKKKRF